MTAQEQRIHRLARKLIPELKRRGTLPLRGGRWEFGTDFAKTPQLVWAYSGRRKQPFAVIPDETRIVGLGPLRYGYAEKKLTEAEKALG